jgi:hypothetical protein
VRLAGQNVRRIPTESVTSARYAPLYGHNYEPDRVVEIHEARAAFLKAIPTMAPPPDGLPCSLPGTLTPNGASMAGVAYRVSIAAES